ncbi:acetyltransferase [Paenibacillus oenotherae]|uniref:Lysine N-acyltransferase MbtK n=1 Tax=Paenibacillus oenotherae TaxID=1435645 RepID=A0ABS7D4S7_9BACL|nr:GNAT family N-acetyltransferase [Paenibacillus oenotherae]MBW7474903.1 acetyltransferase [Paenibacillus oenotherae]
MTVGFRPVSIEDDLDRLHDWQQQEHVIPYWKLNIPLAQYRDHLTQFLADSHQALYIGLLDGKPMSYFESYWAEPDIIGRYYEAEPADQGIHLLIGPPEYLGKGLAAPLLQALMRFQFQHAATKKIVAEPDVRNARMIHIFSKCGFRFQKEVALPDKTGALMFAYRDEWNDGSGIHE